ncbi:MAG: glycosyltransferase family 9 protein, partial [Deltaproteobacteria bacterium]|nr:glycosyltransferase family 9 protein [Deltaproteobacteria bacterium]
MAFIIKKLKTIPQNLLVARTDRIGDFILSLPVLEALKKNPGICVSVLCDQLVAPFLKNNPFVDQVITVDKKKSAGGSIQKIKEGRFDGLLVLVNDPLILKILPRLKSVPVRIGPSSKLSAFLRYTHPVVQKRSRSIKNEAEYNLELLEVFGLIADFQIKPKLYFDQAEVKGLKDKHSFLFKNPLQKKIVFHSGMKGSALNLKQERYEELLSWMLAEGYIVFLSGYESLELEANRNYCRIFKDYENKQLFDLSGQLGLREYAVLISLSDLFIGPSTGPTHIANAAGTPLISFYPPIL